LGNTTTCFLVSGELAGETQFENDSERFDGRVNTTKPINIIIKTNIAAFLYMIYIPGTKFIDK
jgi:hypothetical protein